MKKFTVEELKQLIENHCHWLCQDCDGWENMRADFRHVNLRGVNFQGANLRGADFQYADLQGADFRYADLQCAKLQYANLRHADLWSADLQYADFQHADLESANLSNANFKYADLQYANLQYTDLQGTKNLPYIPMACPDTGAFIGWKKVNGYIVKLQVPGDAKRSSATTTKCRCDKALVLAIEDEDGINSSVTTLINKTYAPCIYTIGEMVYSDSWDNNRWNECSHGIHFFINRQEAVNWQVFY